MKKLLFILLLLCATNVWAEDEKNISGSIKFMTYNDYPKILSIYTRGRILSFNHNKMTAKQLTGFSVMATYANSWLSDEEKEKIYQRIIKYYQLDKAMED